MPDDPRRDADDLEHALFDARPDAPTHHDDADLDVVLFGTERSGTGTEGAAVGYAEAPLSRTRRVLVGLAVVALTGLVVMATVAFASGSDDSGAKQVRIPARSNVTSTSVALRAPSSLPGASAPGADTTPATTDKPAGTTATTRRRTTPATPATNGGPADPEPLPALPPLDFPTDPPATTPTAPPTTPTTRTTTTTTSTTTTTEPTTTTLACPDGEVCP